MGAVLLLPAYANQHEEYLPSLFLAVSGLLFIFLSADEGALIHERSESRLRTREVHDANANDSYETSTFQSGGDQSGDLFGDVCLHRVLVACPFELREATSFFTAAQSDFRTRGVEDVDALLFLSV